MPFRHDAGVFRPNAVSRRNFDGLKTPNPSSFGHRVCLGKKVEAKNPNGVSAKCAIPAPWSVTGPRSVTGSPGYRLPGLVSSLGSLRRITTNWQLVDNSQTRLSLAGRCRHRLPASYQHSQTHVCCSLQPYFLSSHRSPLALTARDPPTGRARRHGLLPSWLGVGPRYCFLSINSLRPPPSGLPPPQKSYRSTSAIQPCHPYIPSARGANSGRR